MAAICCLVRPVGGASCSDSMQVPPSLTRLSVVYGGLLQALGTFMTLLLTSLHPAQFNLIVYGPHCGLAWIRNIGYSKNKVSIIGDDA